MISSDIDKVKTTKICTRGPGLLFSWLTFIGGHIVMRRNVAAVQKTTWIYFYISYVSNSCGRSLLGCIRSNWPACYSCWMQAQYYCARRTAGFRRRSCRRTALASGARPGRGKPAWPESRGKHRPGFGRAGQGI